MLVYRVEHSTIIDPVSRHYGGPYRAFKEQDSVSFRIDLAHMMDDDRRPPLYDGIFMEDVTMVCGFASMVDLCAWFDEWMAELSLYGFVVGIYDVPEDAIRFGAKQIVFHTEDATLVSTQQL